MRLSKKMKFVNLVFVLSCVAAAAYWFALMSAQDGFSTEGFMPHGHCYLWTPALVWAMVGSDFLIGAAYMSISICLYVLVRRIRLPFSAMFLAFGVFIAACGATHFMEIYTLWNPSYWFSALIKIITALASVATAIIMFPLFPKVVALATSARLSEERKTQLEVANAELEKRTEELVVINRELEAFSYSVSHDLRSPLRGINGFSQALAEDYADKLDEQGRQYLAYIRNDSQRMGKIIDDLLNLSRITRQELNPKHTDLSAFASSAVENLKNLEPHRRVEISIQSGVQASGDPGQLRIVIENLISNAWKFTSKAVGARIEFGEQKDASGRPCFFVRDNGAGFDMAYSAKLFGAFQRLHSPDQFEGTGIGLATAKRIISRHHGRIWAESELGKGTTFYFTLEENDV